MNVPRVIIAGLYGEGGKTTVATGLMGTLKKKGLKVQPFKVGPDYIDGSYHTAVTNRPSRHLDPWLTSPQTVLEIFENACKDADVAVIEGFMGLFDGLTRVVNGAQDFGSTAQIAQILKVNVVLVLDVTGMRINAATVVHGFKSFNEKVKVKSVILNNVRSQQQAEWMKQTIESITKVPVFGLIPYNEEIFLPTRRGGLIPIPEKQSLKTTVSKLVEYVGERVDIDEVFNIAEDAEELPDIDSLVYPSQPRTKKVRLCMAFDEAFNFYYPTNIDLLRAYGAETVFFSPIHDEKLPSNIDGLYFPGGFPDMLAGPLTKNQTMRKSVKDAVYDEMPVYSEHGGSLYLTKSITNVEGAVFPMTEALPGKALMEKKLQALDSTLIETIEDNLLSKKGTTIHGHEYHFSKITDTPKDTRFAFKMGIGKGIDGQHEGWMEHNTLAILGHLNFAFNSEFAENLIRRCEQYRHK
ncbi:MAG: cobyrinate a,c-diamide synthase [Candidatus Bathyarchaeia archaeon]|nr:cobyrinate a,c-diamide synthase [Candidatus Bathyarchaeia archaeon]